MSTKASTRSAAALALIAALLVAPAGLGSGADALAATPSPTPSPSQTATPSPSETPSPSPTSTAPCSAAKAISQSALGNFYGYVIDVTTGKVLLSKNGTSQTPSASVLKVLSAAAAMKYLPVGYRAKTTVKVDAAEPGTVYLVGGGDFSLSRLTGSQKSAYVKAPRIEKLADRTLAAWNLDVPISKIVLDASFFDGAAWTNSWKQSDRTNGYISLITALQADADRRNPDLTSKKYSGVRSLTPVANVGKYFKKYLGDMALDAKIVEGVAPATATTLTYLQSQPMDTWLNHAMKYSDNTETEYLARHAAKAAGYPADFKSLQPMVRKMLDDLGIYSKRLVMKDGSGLAQGNRVTAKLIAQLMAETAKPGSSLAALEGYLPVAGTSGTLSGRFTGKNAMARGFVKAKSGFIPGLYSLAGIIDAKDGHRLAFAAFARSGNGKTVGYQARPALDTVASRFYQCGARLTN